MPTLDKAKINVGVSNHAKLDLSHDHITTSNFMDMQPVCYRHMMPSEKYKVNCSAFARLAPLSVPTYGRCRLNLRAFFVPFRTVMPLFNEFIVDTVSANFNSISTPSTGIVASTPILKNSSIVTLFETAVIVGYNGVSYSFHSAGTALDYDWQDGGVYYKFTPIGRRFYKILRSLGYDFIPHSRTDDISFSALSLLAYLRVYFDWYSLSAYMDTQTYQLFNSWFTYHNPNLPLRLDSTALAQIAKFLMRVCYDGDYFTAAWDNPTAPNSQLFSPFLIPDLTYNPYDPNAGYGAAVATAAGNGTPIATNTINSNQDSVYVLSQYADSALHALTDYMKRHQLVGARAVDRYLADFGINLPADKLNRSTYLGCSSIDIQIGDVMSHSDTATGGNPSNLGDYAGQGYLKGGKEFEFQASEFGLFVVVSSIMPAGGYVQGYDRNNLHVTKDSFFNPDFDNLGVQALERGELYISKNDVFGNPSDYRGVFGYVPRYAEYKVGRDQLTGDISLPSVLAGGDSWHLMRMFDDTYFSGAVSNIQHNLSFCVGEDADQYSRIFNSTDPDYDKFYIVYHFDAVAYAPCNSLFDTYEFMNYGKQITMDSNGVKMN